MAEYQISLLHEIEGRLKAKCDKLADAFVMDDIGQFLSLSLCICGWVGVYAHVFWSSMDLIESPSVQFWPTFWK